MNPLPGWLVFALASAFFAALTAIFGKLGVEGLNSNLATFIRSVVIVCIIAGIVSLRGEWQNPAQIGARNWLFLILSALATGLSWLCYYRALQLGPVSKVAPVDKLSVALAIVMGLLFLGETLTWKAALGAALIVAGTLLMVLL
ncbi:EamA family transporter [Massilia sp. erpn]|uniref:EamA family transporter n=1 Tax=Massilia sp. erpn TaxID=2738142 RepID=UPI0021066776|nr:EamA family transporter [Massilia sp. erpn]UTY57628.1 EamA family transporter [Massilia sp. erpn]